MRETALISLERGTMPPPPDNSAAVRIVSTLMPLTSVAPAGSGLLRLIFADEGLKAEWQGGYLPVQRQGRAFVVELAVGPWPAGTAAPLVLTWSRPWHEAMPLAPLLAGFEGRRVFVVPGVGFAKGIWHDGPLAHISEDGCLRSYVPAGGPARLSLPALVGPADKEGWPLAKASSLEGSPAEAACRILSHAVSALLPDQWDDDLWITTSTEAGLLQAIALSLVRKARPVCRLRLVAPSPAVSLQAMRPAFRRFLQNAGIIVTKASTLTNVFALRLVEDLVPKAELQSLAAAINALSDVIPLSLCEIKV